MQDLAFIRKEYTKAQLDDSSVVADPLLQFDKWFQNARHAEVAEPTAMSLATVNNDGRPSCRIVLLKGVENRKFVFYTNYQSHKGTDLINNPACALTFFWPELERQVRIEGIATRIAPERSDQYFQSRPRGSQLGAWASPQSSLIGDRSILDERMKELDNRFKGKEKLPRPHQWGGFEVDPMIIEFWQGRPNRLHDRIHYVLVDGNWQHYRLAP